MSPNVSRKDVVLAITAVTLSVTSLLAGVRYVDERLQEHMQAIHPTAVTREEFRTYHEMIMDRLRTIEQLLRK